MVNLERGRGCFVRLSILLVDGSDEGHVGCRSGGMKVMRDSREKGCRGKGCRREEKEDRRDAGK